MQRLPRAGNTVRVPQAFGYVQATVTQVVGEGDHAQVLVDVPVHGAWGEELGTETMSYPVTALERTDAPQPARG